MFAETFLRSVLLYAFWGPVVVVQIVWLIREGAYRIPKLKALTSTDYPNIAADEIEKWKALHLKSYNVLFWGTLGMLFIVLPLLFADIGPLFADIPRGLAMKRIVRSIVSHEPELSIKRFMGSIVFYVAAYLALLVFSGIYGSKATTMKKRLGIGWPKKRGA